MLSERAQEAQELRKQLSERQQQLAAAERHGSTTAQESHVETAELRALLAEKESIINVGSSGTRGCHSSVKMRSRDLTIILLISLILVYYGQTLKCV